MSWWLEALNLALIHCQWLDFAGDFSPPFSFFSLDRLVSSYYQVWGLGFRLNAASVLTHWVCVRARALSTKFNNNPAISSRPFDRARDGFV